MLLPLLFGASGAAALVHQVLWFRVLAVHFGTTVHAAAAVLAGFMGGLWLGSLAGGYAADRLSSPRARLIGFGVIEVAIGAIAAALLFVLPRADTFGLALAAMALPAAFIGATTPLVLRMARAHAAGAPRVGILLAVNAAGAMLGAAAAALWMIPELGIRLAGLSAAGLNAAVGATALLAARHATAEEDVDVPAADLATWGAPGILPARPLLILAVIVSGFATFALEVIWLRALSAILLRPTAYTFAVVLTAVLAGLSVGGAAAALALRRWRDSRAGLSAAGLGAAACAIGGAYGLAIALEAFSWPVALAASSFGMFATACFLGMMLPTAMAAWLAETDDRTAGRRAGALLAVNVSAAVAGALTATFVLLPALGPRLSLIATAALLGLTGALFTPGRTAMRPFAAAVTALAAIAVLGARAPDLQEAALAGRYPGDTLLWRDRAPQATVAVHRSADGIRTLWVNGIHQANDGPEAVAFHRRLARLPLDLHGAARRYLSVGLGAGTTAGEAARTGGLAVDVAEISPEVVDAAVLFAHVNQSVLTRPNVRIVIRGGRRHVARHPGVYDVITADAVVPMYAGGGILNSEEYFRLVQRSLTEGGLFAQWLGPTGETAWKLIARTFIRVFPDATLWSGRILIGGLGPRAAWSAAAQQAAAGELTADAESLRGFVGDGPILTDDKPRVEYFLSLPNDEKIGTVPIFAQPEK